MNYPNRYVVCSGHISTALALAKCMFIKVIALPSPVWSQKSAHEIWPKYQSASPRRYEPANQGFHKYVFSVVSGIVASKFAPWEWNIKFNELLRNKINVRLSAPHRAIRVNTFCEKKQVQKVSNRRGVANQWKSKNMSIKCRKYHAKLFYVTESCRQPLTLHICNM